MPDIGTIEALLDEPLTPPPPRRRTVAAQLQASESPAAGALRREPAACAFFDPDALMKATGTCKPTKWDETTLAEISAEVRTTRVTVTFAFSGGIEGEALAESLMFYPHHDAADPHRSTARYVGMMRLTGKVNGRGGSFVIEEAGRFEGGVAESTLTIMEGSGTGELAGIRGSGHFHATKDGATVGLDYELA